MKDFKAIGTLIHGIAASEHLDSSGERISVKGLDITSLPVDGVYNWEHKNDNSFQIVGKILKAKKIFSQEDCADEHELYFWNISQAPFVYTVGELFDGVGHKAAAEVAAMFRYDTIARKEGRPGRNVVNFSIEGSKLGKEGQDIQKSLGRKITITTAACNKVAIAEELSPLAEQKDQSLDFAKSEQFASLEKKIIQVPSFGQKPFQPKKVGGLPHWANNASDVDAFRDKTKTLNRQKQVKDAQASFSAKLPTSSSAGSSKIHSSLPAGTKYIDKLDRIKKATTAGSGMMAPSAKMGGDALATSEVESGIKKLPQFSKFLKFIKDKYPEMTKDESEAMAKYFMAKHMIKAEETLEKMMPKYGDSKSKFTVHVRTTTDQEDYEKHSDHNDSDSASRTARKLYDNGHHSVKVTDEKGKENSDWASSKFAKAEDLDKSKNVREQRKKVFGTDPNAPRVSDKRSKMMNQIKQFVENRFGMPLETAQGKRDESGKMRTDKDNQPAYDVFSPKGVSKEKKLLEQYKKKGIKRVDPKPDWRSGKLETQPSPDAATHEVGHLYLAPEGMTPAMFQEHMDTLWGESQSKYGHMQQKKTSGEIQPMAVENSIRREMGLPANRATKPVKQNERALDYEGDRFVEGKDSKGRKAFYDRQTRLQTPETKERVQQVREGSLKFHPDRGWFKDASPDTLINLRGRGQTQEAQQRAQQKYVQPAAPKKMAASEMEKGRDVLSDKLTSKKGVSETGVEVRRSDKRNKGAVSHGYSRVSNPEYHKEKAAYFIKEDIKDSKKQPKPNLPKSEDMVKRCWSGFKPVSGKKPYSKGSCEKK